MHLRRCQPKATTLVLPVILWVASWLGAPTTQAQDIQITGPLARASAVRDLRLYRKHRFQIQPFIGFTLQDQYSRTMLFGGQLNYHIWDWLGVGVWGGYGGVHLDTNLADQVASKGQTTVGNTLSLPSRDYFKDQIGKINWVVAGQVTFVPLRGKLALFQKLFVDTDFYVFAGVAAVGVQERASVADPSVCSTIPAFGSTPSDNACVNTQVQRASRVAIAPTFGVGLTLYMNRFIGVSLEWRGLPFSWNTSGTDERGSGPDGKFPDGQINSSDRIFHFNHMVNLGVAFYLPTKVSLGK